MFKTGDKVVCVDNDGWSQLTLYGTYIIESDWLSDIALIIEIDNINTIIPKRRFVSVVEFRKQKLEKICSNLEIK